MSFDEVYRAHVAFVWRTVRRFGVDEADLEDAVHEVFLVVHRQLADFDGEAAITSWLYAIARGVASNRRRSVQRRERRHEAAPAPANLPGPGEQLERARAAEAMEQFLCSLPADQRTAFELFEIEGMTGAEIGAALGLNINTVYTRLRAARQRFEHFLQAHHAGDRRATHG